MNAGRNTTTHTPHPPIHHDQDELAEESSWSEHQFISYIIAHGIPLAEYENTNE